MPTKLTANEIILKYPTEALYALRKIRASHPEGRFDNAQRWYPNLVEDADGDGSKARSPTRTWPFSYMLRCRTRQHCKVFIERYLAGYAVPDVVERLEWKTLWGAVNIWTGKRRGGK